MDVDLTDEEILRIAKEYLEGIYRRS